MTHFMKWSGSCGLLFLLLQVHSCGVNTGNPGTKFTQERATQTGSSMSLAINPLPGGTMQLQVKALGLVPVGETLSSKKIVTIPLEGSTFVRTGQMVKLLNNFELAPGLYNRLLLIVDAAKAPIFINGSQQEQKVALAPYKYYDNSEADAASDVVQITMALDKDFTVTAQSSTLVGLTADVQKNLKPFDGGSVKVQDYYKARGETDYAFSFDPDTNAAVAVPQEPSVQGEITVEIYPKTPANQFVSFCIYPGLVPTTDLATDLECRKAQLTGTTQIIKNVMVPYAYVPLQLPFGWYTVSSRSDSNSAIGAAHFEVLRSTSVRRVPVYLP